MVISFCGHADYCSSPADEARMQALLAEYVGDFPAEFLLGGYGRFDAFAHVCAEKYKSAHPQVSLILVTPYLPKKGRVAKEEGYDILLYPPIEHVPPRYAIYHRNRYMMEKADVVIAYVRHKWGGAYQAYCHAKAKGKIVAPFERGRS